MYPVGSENGSDPVNATTVMYIGPSITTYVDLNPGYRIYDVERDGNKVHNGCRNDWLQGLVADAAVRLCASANKLLSGEMDCNCSAALNHILHAC